jgi:hypothetical protein
MSRKNALRVVAAEAEGAKLHAARAERKPCRYSAAWSQARGGYRRRQSVKLLPVNVIINVGFARLGILGGPG